MQSLSARREWTARAASTIHWAVLRYLEIYWLMIRNSLIREMNFKANFILYPDMSHLYHRAQIGAMQDAGIFRMWLLLMVSWNLVHGKDLDDSRFIQLRHAMQEHYEFNTHETSVLFQHFLTGLAKELEMQG